jgi:hypothetical protein
MNDHRLREAVSIHLRNIFHLISAPSQFGVPQNVTYILLAGEENGIRFAQNGDLYVICSNHSMLTRLTRPSQGPTRV